MVLLLPSLFLAAYAIISGVITLSCPRWVKIILGLVILIVALKYQIYTINGGTFLQPSVSVKTMLVYEALYGGLVVFVFLLILKDLMNLGFWLLTKWSVLHSFSLNRNGLLISLALVSVCAGIWGTWEATKVPDIKRLTIHIKNLPNQWDGVRIVQLSDLHIGYIQRQEWLAKVVRKVNELKPDVVLITGDFVDGTVPKLLGDMLPLTQLKSKFGVYAVPGNHEYYSGYASWMKALPKLGITMLENSSVTLEYNKAKLVIGGTTDYGASRFGLESPNLWMTFLGTPEDAVRILLTHQPKTTHQSTEKFDLQLSGHTHGGHIFFLHPLIALFNDGLVSGLYQRGDRQIYVHNGTGLWNGFSQRIFVPSEITEITLAP